MSTNQKRNLIDKCIRFVRATRYALTEPTLLKLARKRHEHEYNIGTNPLVSIIMPTYNRGKLLIERTLPSILNQTYQNFEIIIVGDCTPDNTADLVARMQDQRLRFFNLSKRPKYPKETKNRWFVGGVPPRNYGLTMARGAWIAELDDDDIWTPDHIESLLRFAQEGNYEFAVANYETERYGKRILVDEKDADPRIGGISTWFYRSYLKFFAYNFESWRKDYDCPQETDRWLRMRSAGVRMGYLEKVLAFVLPLPGSPTVGLDALEIITGEKLR